MEYNNISASQQEIIHTGREGSNIKEAKLNYAMQSTFAAFLRFLST
jgi:hypothetical protein